MSIWQEFDNKINSNFVNEVKNTVESNADFEDLPLGRYEVAINSMALKESKKGNPMIATCFKVVEGVFKNRLIFKNSVIYVGDENDTYRLSNELRFLKSLGYPKEKIVFTSFSQFDNLIIDIYNYIKDNQLEHLLEISERNGFKNYTIREIYAPSYEETPQDLEPPF